MLWFNLSMQNMQNTCTAETGYWQNHANYIQDYSWWPNALYTVHITSIFSLDRHRRRRVLSSSHVSTDLPVCPSVRPERRYRSNCLRFSAIGLKFGGMKRITVSNGHAQPMFAFSDLDRTRVLSFSERLAINFWLEGKIARKRGHSFNVITYLLHLNSICYHYL